MRWPASRPLVWGTVAVIGALAAMTGCSTDDKVTPPAAVNPSTPDAPARQGVVSVSPAGTTTKVDVPARSTEEEYFQACHAATSWMKGHSGDHQVMVESYLAAVQKPGVIGPGTWNIAWAALPLARQAGVIVAATAAANDECG